MSRHPAAPGLSCPSCGHLFSKVGDTRARQGYVYRRRDCLHCDANYATREIRVADLETLTKSVDYAQHLRTALNDFLRGGR